MPRYTDVMVARSTALLQFSGGGSNYVVKTPGGVLYCVYVDTGSDIAFRKSENNGLTWSAAVIVFAGTVTGLSIWYDRWSDIAAGLIHCAYWESVTDNVLYRTINTESSDALSTQTVIFDGVSTATGGWGSITRSRGGNVYFYGCIDAGEEGGFFRLPNANVPNGAWDAARTNPEALATTDMAILVPGFAADNQDIMCMFWDASANEVSRYIYDDSLNTWAETSIATSMTDQAATVAFPHFDAAVDITNSRILLVAWSGVDTLNSDLRCWTVTESTITEVTNVVLNSTDDQGLCAIGIDTTTNYWYVWYGGKSDGSETFLTNINIYMKVSTDAGSTWGPETLATTSSITKDITWLVGPPRFTGPWAIFWHNDISFKEIMATVQIQQPQARAMIGI